MRLPRKPAKPTVEPMDLRRFAGLLTALMAAACICADAEAANDTLDPAAVANDVATESKHVAGLVRVRLPITGDDDESIRRRLNRVSEQLIAEARRTGQAERPILFLEIAPTAGSPNDGADSQFERASGLASTIGRLSDVKTVAWIPATIRGHGVLAALACEEIVMAPDAEIGEAGADEDGIVARSTVQRYREVARDVGALLDEALAVAMVDPAAEVVRIQGEEGVRFLLREDVDDYRETHEVIDEQVFVASGTMASFTGREGRELGFVRYLGGDRRSIARVYNVDVASLKESELSREDWRPVVVELDGPITANLATQLTTLIGQQLDEGANWICLRIDSSGGDLTASVQLAAIIAELDAETVRTVAYVPAQARGGAALAALACDDLVMHPEAQLGASPDISGPAEPPADPRRLPPPGAAGLENNNRIRSEIEAADLTSLKSLASKCDRPWSLLQAMVDGAVSVFVYSNQATGEQRPMSEEEAATLVDSADWNRGPSLTTDGALLLDGDIAAQHRIAAHSVETFDEVGRLYGIDSELTFAEPNWALQLIQALASPQLSAVLIMLGIGGLYIELKTPGLGVGGFLSAVAFLLFFWSNFLDGSATWFEVLMFVAGFVFLLVEVFVIPGFGIFGLGGGILVIFSLVLASQRFFIPRTEAQLEELRHSLTSVAAAGVGVFAFAWATRHYLPQAPLLRRIMLEPPPPEEQQMLSSREAVADYAYLVDAQGEAFTDLRPSGKALIHNEVVDVIAEGEPIDRGDSIVVVDAHANRVLVRRVGPGSAS